MSIYDDMIAVCACDQLRQRLTMAAAVHGPTGINPEWWAATHIQRLAADSTILAAWNGPAVDGETGQADRISADVLTTAVQTLVAADQAAEDAAAAAKAKADADEAAARQAADAALRQQQKDDQIALMQAQAQITAQNMPAPVDTVSTEPAPAAGS